jgi:alcohol dehydrogenase class IV
MPEPIRRNIVLSQPPKIVFGSNCALDCVEYLRERRLRRLLVVTSPSVLKLLDRFLDALRAEAESIVVHSRVQAEPNIGTFEEALAVARGSSLDAVIGVGGGSVLDVAKLVAALAQSDQTIRQVFGINNLSSRKIALLCLPTTAGTGSEVSPNAILLDESENLKKGVISPYLVPDAAFVDPLLTLSVPPSVTASTGLDALVHCIEAYANKFAHPTVDLYALEGIRLINSSLERAVQHGEDIHARANMALGSLYGGLCLGPVNTAAVHALAYPLGSEFHVAHGLSNAVLLPHVLRFNLRAAIERYATIARTMGIPDAGAPEETAARGIEYLAELSRRLGVPQHLAELGVPSSALPRMAKSAMTITRLLKNNPRELTEADALAIYEAAF